jgi:hypothetical protein
VVCPRARARRVDRADSDALLDERDSDAEAAAGGVVVAAAVFREKDHAQAVEETVAHGRGRSDHQVVLVGHGVPDDDALAAVEDREAAAAAADEPAPRRVESQARDAVGRVADGGERGVRRPGGC